MVYSSRIGLTHTNGPVHDLIHVVWEKNMWVLDILQNIPGGDSHRKGGYTCVF